MWSLIFLFFPGYFIDFPSHCLMKCSSLPATLEGASSTIYHALHYGSRHVPQEYSVDCVSWLLRALYCLRCPGEATSLEAVRNVELF